MQMVIEKENYRPQPPGGGKVNTFQAVLITDGNLTFLLFNYEDIQWPSVDDHSSVYIGSLALVGLNSGYTTGYYTIPGSLSPAIGNISHTSNINVTGRWVFKVDQLHPEDVNGILDDSTDSTVEPTTTHEPVDITTISTTVPPFVSSSDLLYPYGSAIDTINPKSDDGSSPLIGLSTSIPLFGNYFSSLYVNNNGLLSFSLPIWQYVPQELPVAFGNPFLALFWADIDNRVAGDIYFRQTTDHELLDRTTSDIRAYFHQLNFTAQWVFVATWHRVAYFGSSNNKVNTLQAVLSTDGNMTFVLLNYEDIQWPSLEGNSSVYEGRLALAGLNSGYNTGYYTIPGSLSLAIGNISHTSNVNVPGRWVFKVDKLHPEDVNGSIESDDSTDSTTEPTTTRLPVYSTTMPTTVPSFVSSSDLLYPYGSAVDTINPKALDGWSPLIGLSIAVPLFGNNYYSLYVNTFQAVLITDGNLTFLLFNYEDIQWPSVEDHSSVYIGALALAGLNSGYYTGYYTIPGSLSLAIGNISHTSNINIPGRWAFKVDQLHPEDVNGILDDSTDSTVEPTTTYEPVYTTTMSTSVPPFVSSSDLLYPYGSAIDTINLKSDDGSSPLIGLSTSIPLFGNYFSSLYVNNNGLLSFSLPIRQWTPQALPVAFGNPFLALFWADIDNRIAGDIYFRQSTDHELLARTTSDIRSYFHHLNFIAQWVFVATWDRVAYYSSSTNKVNTFQAVLSTDGNMTFVLLNYEDIQWPSVESSSSVYGGPIALAGLNSGYNTGYYTIPGSLSPAIVNISHTSNVNVTGRWVFKVDNLHPEDVNGILDDSTDSTVEPTTTHEPVYTTTMSTTVPPFVSSSDLLYPYGSAIDTINLKSDDGSSPLLGLSTSIPFFGNNFSSLYVNNNGLLSFHLPIGQWTPQALPLAFGNPFLALFWADIDNRIAGDIYFRQSTDPVLLARATSDIRAYFYHLNFIAQWVFVATWHRVAYFRSSTNKVNTFQAVLSTDGSLTFVLFNYEDIQWPSLESNSLVYGGPLALAGLNSGYYTGYYTIPGSLSPAVVNISHTSNVNVTGRWVFKVDQLHPEDVNGILGKMKLPSLH
ncbi:uncharacterized protein LOC142107448 [Mixophyes fleayi]|uniref:uncharacterized protein LOC142107448 n=1 Tax=Mixophyes fleayi TaxID=3061075 RepID=UPI003F4DA8A0